jgi:hypothetical protein
MDCSVGYDKRRDKYGMRKGNTLKVDVVGENAKRRRLMVVAIFIPKLANTNSGKNCQNLLKKFLQLRYLILLRNQFLKYIPVFEQE